MLVNILINRELIKVHRYSIISILKKDKEPYLCFCLFNEEIFGLRGVFSKRRIDHL